MATIANFPTIDAAQRRQDALGVRLYRAWQALGLHVKDMPVWPSEALVEEYEREEVHRENHPQRH